MKFMKSVTLKTTQHEGGTCQCVSLNAKHLGKTSSCAHEKSFRN